MSIKDVSIPQGVDVKHYNANILHWQSSVSIPQGVDVKHSTGIVLEVVPEVSIPQGVDVKRRCGSIRVLQGRCINPTRGGRQTRLCLWLKSPTRVSIPQGVDVKLFLCDLIVYYRQYQSHKGWTSNSPILALMLAF